MSSGKKQPRTKGNVKPSSSARAAELLSAEGFGIPNTVGFMGFDAIPIKSDSFNSTTNVDEPEDLDEDFRVAFRKAMKKDYVTKTKALREIATLISEKELKIVLLAWQCWPRLYSKLALDSYFKVRELSHSVLGAFSQKLTRQIAGQLKQIVPYWLMGEHDPYQVASQAAKQTFHEAFPSNKRSQVLAFCKEAVITICSPLAFSVDETGAASSASAADNSEESPETRAIRISSCSLWAINTLLSTISDEELSSGQEILLQSLLSLPKFWKIGDKTKAVPVRVAWFNLLLCLIRRHHSALSERASKLVPAIVNALEETDTAVVGPIWECVADYLTVNAEEFWQNCNFRKAFLPKLVANTRKAFNGCSNVVANSIIVIFGRLPISDDLAEVYEKLLSAFPLGVNYLLESKVQHSEVVAFTRIYCNFMASICSNDTTIAYAAELLRDPEKSLFVLSTFLKSSSPLLTADVFNQWAILASTILDDLPSKKPELADAVSAFKSNLYQLLSMELQVKSSTASLSNVLVAVCGRVTDFKSQCASICNDCWALYERTGDSDYLRIFRNVLCSSTDVSGFVGRLYGDDNATTSAKKLVDALTLRLFVIDGDQSLELDQVGNILDCIFVVFTILDSSEQAGLLKKLCQLTRFDVQYQFLAKLRQAKNESMLEIVPQLEFSALFMDCFKTLCSTLSSGRTVEEQRKQWRLFSEYLAGISPMGSSTLPSSVVASALEHLTSLVGPESTGQHLSLIVALVGQLASETFSSHKRLLAEKSGLALILQLFNLYCAHSEELNDEALNWTKTAWSTAIGGATNGELIPALTGRLVDHVRKSGLNRERLEWLALVAIEIVSSHRDAMAKSESASLGSIHGTVSLLVPMDSAEATTDGKETSSMWILAAALSGHLPIFDLNFLADQNMATDRLVDEEYLNLAAYGMRFGCHLNSSESPLAINGAELADEQSALAIRGLSSVAYIDHMARIMSICGHYDHSSALKSFGSWLSLIAIDFWNSLLTSQRHEVARTAIKWILASDDPLEAQAVEFLQYDAQNIDFIFDDLRFDNRQLTTIFCAAPLIAQSHGRLREPEPATSHIVVGYLGIVGNSATKRLTAFDWLMMIKKDFLDEKMLFSCDIGDASDDAVVLNISLMQYFEQVVYCLLEMSSEQRDFLLCATLTWLLSCFESDLSNKRTQLFAVFAARLFCSVSKFMDSDKQRDERKLIVEEWTEFFLKGCVHIVAAVFFKLSKVTCASPLEYFLLREVSAAVEFAREEDLMDVELSPLLAPELDSLGYPEKLQTLLLNALPSLESQHVSVQVAAFRVMERFVGQLYEYESKSVKETDGADVRELPSYFLNIINRSYETIEAILDDIHHLENIPAFSTYFLTWKLLLKFFASIKTEDRAAYSSALASSKILDKLMLTLLTALPENILSSSKNQSPDGGSEFNRHLLRYESRFEDVHLKSIIEVGDVGRAFLDPPEYSAGMSTTRFVQEYSCHIFYETMRSFPAAIRQWYNAQEKKVANIVERFVTKYVSPLLCSSDLQAITKGEKKYENMTLVARPMAREVIACYKLDELTMELIVTLPQNYPLNAAMVDVDRRVGVSVEQWRKWMLQLTVFLSHQNGALLDGMLLWKRCIDKHLQGVEDCMICMMAVHGSNYQLPKITCKQCKKKFHAACLYKWFNTSSHTSCPLCRTTF